MNGYLPCHPVTVTSPRPFVGKPCLNDSSKCGLQLAEVVKFEQLSESWFCEPRHVRLHQVAILLGTQPRLLLHEVLYPSFWTVYSQPPSLLSCFPSCCALLPVAQMAPVDMLPKLCLLHTLSSAIYDSHCNPEDLPCVFAVFATQQISHCTLALSLPIPLVSTKLPCLWQVIPALAARCRFTAP